MSNQETKPLGVVVAYKGSRLKTGGGYSSFTSKLYATEGKAKAALNLSNHSDRFKQNPEEFVFIPVYLPE